MGGVKIDFFSSVEESKVCRLVSKYSKRQHDCITKQDFQLFILVHYSLFPSRSLQKASMYCSTSVKSAAIFDFAREFLRREQSTFQRTSLCATCRRAPKSTNTSLKKTLFPSVASLESVYELYWIILVEKAAFLRGHRPT